MKTGFNDRWVGMLNMEGVAVIVGGIFLHSVVSTWIVEMVLFGLYQCLMYFKRFRLLQES